MLVQEPVQAAIWHCLNHYAYSDATFLAERLNAELNNEDTLFLLATCYYRANKKNQCYSILHDKYEKGSLNPRCRYLLSLCCTEMNKLHEAEEVLILETNTSGVSSKPSGDVLDAVVTTFGDSAPFACQLLGRITDQSSRHQESHDAYNKSLKLNPFLWHSFHLLCQNGENIDPEAIFTMAHLESFSMCNGSQNVVSLIGNQTQEPVVMGICNYNSIDIQPKFVSTPMMNRYNVKPIPVHIPEETAGILHPSNNKSRPVKYRNLFTSTPVGVGGNGNNNSSPRAHISFGMIPLGLDSSGDLSHNNQNSTPNSGGSSNTPTSPFMMISPSPNSHDLSSEPRAKKPCLRLPPSWQQQQASSILTAHSPSPIQTTGGQQPLSPQTANVRRSSRLFSNSNVSVKENSKTPARARVTPSKSPNRKNKLRGTNKTGNGGNNASFSEKQKNCLNQQMNEVTEGDGDGDKKEEIRFVTPPCDQKLNTSAAPTNTQPNCLSFNTPVQAQNAFQIQKQAAEGLMELLRHFGKAYVHLCRYECKEAILSLTEVRPNHDTSGWVLGMKAKAFFELGNYEQAINAYERMRKSEPHRIEGLEWLSTAHWHMQHEIELSALATELLGLEREHPATWITVGNCFSLNKEHETAIKFFERAIQVDENCAYGYTLLGHEYVAIEELDRALKCFRSAIRIHTRHYNAWYGLGMIYYKQERYQRAEVYYKKALEIHPKNSILLCHLGVVQHALNKPEQSLESFAKGLAVTPDNPLCKFHRASVFLALNRLDEALTELLELKHIVPKESLVYFLIAKIYSKKNETHQALLHFSWATDLDPKGANNQIKESIEPVLSRSVSTGNNEAVEGEPEVARGGDESNSEIIRPHNETVGAASMSIIEPSDLDSTY